MGLWVCECVGCGGCEGMGMWVVRCGCVDYGVLVCELWGCGVWECGGVGCRVWDCVVARFWNPD